MTTIQIRPEKRGPLRGFPDSSTYNHYHRPGWIVSGHTYPSDVYSIGWEPEGQLDLEQELRKRIWAIPTIQAIEDLPWSNGNWVSGGRQTSEVAVLRILEVLVAVLEDLTPAPTVVPTWSGGVQVEWHRNEVDFEIEADPHGEVEYFFSGPFEEREGKAWDDFSHLSKYVRAVTASE